MLVNELRQQGDTLYRWRSYMPVPMVLLLFVAMASPPAPWWPFAAWWDWLALGVSLAGLAFRGYTIGHAPPLTSGGNLRKQVAEQLNTTGSYSIVRHPLYLGNLLMWLGPTLFVRSTWIVIVCVLAFWIYYERIMYAEESFLETRFGDQFRAWSSATPAFLLSFANWESPRSPFSMRRLLRREYNALLATIVVFSLLDLWRSWLHGPRLALATPWIYLLAAASVLFVLCVFLKKRTSVLEARTERPVARGAPR